MIANVYINMHILSKLGLQQIGFDNLNAKSRVQTLLTLASLFLVKLHHLDKWNILILQESHIFKLETYSALKNQTGLHVSFT